METKIKRKLNISKNTEHLNILKNIDKSHFRVSIFGSARIKENEKSYKEAFELAKKLGENGIDIVTGGGPGIMQAANAGHEKGDPNNNAKSIGLTIQLPWEAHNNEFLELEKHFQKFSSRLDTFMAISHIVVIMPGGIGTCLELFYTLQLTQVKHIDKIPIIVVSKMWKELVKWMKKYPVKEGLISPEDLTNLYVAKNYKDATKLILKENEKFKALKENERPLNINNYKLD